MEIVSVRTELKPVISARGWLSDAQKHEISDQVRRLESFNTSVYDNRLNNKLGVVRKKRELIASMEMAKLN